MSGVPPANPSAPAWQYTYPGQAAQPGQLAQPHPGQQYTGPIPGNQPLYPQLHNQQGYQQPPLCFQPQSQGFPPMGFGYPGPQQPYTRYPAGFNPQAGYNPAAMGYPGFPSMGSAAHPHIQQSTAPSQNAWAPTRPEATVPSQNSWAPTRPEDELTWVPLIGGQFEQLRGRAVEGGRDQDGGLIWVCRARYEGDVIPGKFVLNHKCGYIPYGQKEVGVDKVEILCARADRVRWVASSYGQYPANAIPGGNTSSGEPLYIGRAHYERSITTGKVHPSHKCLYIAFGGEELSIKSYEVLCTV